MGILLLVIIASQHSAFAAYRTQEINLRPGWNAVFLEVQPEPNAPEMVFDGIPVQSVWMPRRSSAVQFIEVPANPVQPLPDWLCYFPPTADEPNPTNLFAIRGGQGYLVRLAGTTPVVWRVNGRIITPAREWVGGSYNLVGFPIDRAAPPSFQSLLGASPAHNPVQAYRLNAAGEWVPIVSPTSERAQPGEAYWVFAKSGSTYVAPLRATLEQAGEVAFGRVVTEQVIRIRNEAAGSKTVRLRLGPSDEAPAEGTLVAGPVPLSYWNTAATPPQWVDFPPSLTRNVAAQTEFSLRVAVRRPDMAPSAEPSALYQSVIDISDGVGTRFDVPVSARSATSGDVAGVSSADRPLLLLEAPNSRAGLWVGVAKVDKVSYAGAANPSQRSAPTSTGSELAIRLIVHIDDSGQARLLQNVTLLWQDGTTKPDPEQPTRNVVDRPGRQILITRPELAADLSGAAVRDGQLAGRRISSAAFGFTTPVAMSGAFDGVLRTAPMKLAYDDPANPFVHKYHPDHDNLGFDFRTPVPEGVESYDIVRTIELQFSETDPEGYLLAGWGDTQVGGSYRETITGVHREALNVAGTFRLNHVSRVDQLDAVE